MGRPLNKKYFGNRNIGTNGNQITGNLSNSQNYADDRIGGGAIASVSAGTVGSFVVNNTYQNFPTLTAAAPTLPGGVTAILRPVFELDTVTYTSGGQTDGDYLAGLSTSITGLGGGAVVNIVEVANKVTAVNLTGGNRGEFLVGDITGVGITSHQVLQAPNAGTDLQITVTFRVKRIEVVNQGSGYVGTPSLSWGGHTFTGQTAPSAQTVTMLVDTGAPGTATNQENAIVMYANVGNGAGPVDIIRQVSTRRYKVTDGTTVGIVELGTDPTPETGEAYLVATATGGTYYVTKLTAHKATLVTKTGDGALNGQAAPWLFDAPTATVVQLENA